MPITVETIHLALRMWGLPPLNNEALQRLIRYAELLQLWNSRVNLTAIRDEAGIVDRHLMEGIFAASLVPVGVRTVLDFGSGAGIPGLPIVILRPALQVTLAESNGKKAAFLREVARQLELPVNIHGERINYRITQAGFDLVTMRAVDRLAAAVLPASVQLAEGGQLMLLISERQEEEVMASCGAVLKRLHWERYSYPAHRPGIVLLGRPS